MGSSTTVTSTAIDSSVKTLGEQAIVSDGWGNKIGTSDITLGAGAQFTATDHNAVEKSFGFGTDTAKMFSMFGERALATVDNANARISNVLDAKAATVPSLQNALSPDKPAVPVYVWIGGGVLLLVVVFVLVKGK